ncbi:hypothetical protein SAMN05661080_04813 [Modestobacter sp. DSM 44400]|nr:hypothetical protein SAMN05661080_04813 [Modestobacter sp. DSM 44400]
MGFGRQPYCGPVVFTGGADEDGNTLGLTEGLAEALTDLVQGLHENPARLEAIRRAALPFLDAHR